jgi:4-amino-4-deoxy-L-arabinose transferase-like glycosyltransferase
LISKILNDKKYFKPTLLAIILFSIALNIIIYYTGLYSISADESGRTIHAYKWVTGTYEGVPTWLPFYTVIIGYGLKFFPDLFITPRIIISIFGVSAFISFIWLTHELFKDRYITILSAVIALFFPARAVLSSVPLSESMFYFFVFSAIALFTRWLNTKNKNLLILTALSFALSSSARYEGWIFSAAFILSLIILKRLKEKEIKTGVIVTSIFIVLTFPVYWFIYQADISGNPLQFFNDMNKHYEHSVGISFFSVLKNNYVVRFIHHNLIYLCFPGLILLVYLFLRESRIRNWVILPLLAFIPLAVISFTGKGIPTHNIWRIPELWNMLLIPFTASFIKNINSFEIKFLKGLKGEAISLLVILILIYYSFLIYSFKHESNFTKDELKIGRYVENNLIRPDANSKILIEVPDWSFLHIAVASNNPGRFVKSSEGGNPKIRRNTTITDSCKIDMAELINRNIKYIMAKTPELKDRITHNPFFIKKKKFNGWSIYEIK